MLASFCGNGLDHCTSDESSGSGDVEEDGSVVIISDLINQGAAINAQTDRTGMLMAMSIMLVSNE